MNLFDNMGTPITNAARLTEKNGCIATFQGQEVVPAKRMAELERDNTRLRDERTVLHNCLRHIEAVAVDSDIRQLAGQGVAYLSNTTMSCTAPKEKL